MEAARQYCLKWNNHPRNVASVFDKLRMEELFVDVPLAPADRQVTLHSCSNSPFWEGNLLSLLARLAEHNAGQIDWSVCLPVIFTRVLKMFSLPVYYSKINVGHKGVSLDSSTAAKWIIYTLGISIQSGILLT